MGKGFLTVELFGGDHVLPFKNAVVFIKDISGSTLYELKTDENGFTEKVPLDAPDKKNISNPNYKGSYFSVYDVEVPHIQGYKKVVVRNVQIFDTITSILPIQVHPNKKENLPKENTEEIIIPSIHGIDLQRDLSDNTDSDAINNSGSVSITNKILENENDKPSYIYNICNSITTEKALANEVSIPDYIIFNLT